MSTLKKSTDQLSQTAETRESGLPETECAERTVTESDPHSYYCPECRAIYDFPWLKAQDCTCQPMHDFIVQHNASHDTKRLQVNTSVNTPARESAVPLRVDLPLADLRTRIADALRNMTGDLTYEAMADAVIAELDRR